MKQTFNFLKFHLLLFFALTASNLIAQQPGIESTSLVLWENFESGTKTAYAGADVILSTGSWYFNDALLGTDANDRKNGTKSVRIRNVGEIKMNFDITTGIDSIKILHAKYGNDANSTWRLEASTNGGTSWDAYQSTTITTSSTSLTEASFEINLAGNVRLRIVKLTGGTARLNFDDISYSPYSGTPVPTVSISPNTLTGMNYNLGFGPSTETNFTVSANFLTANLDIVAPTDFEISLSSGSGFTNSISLTHTSGSIAPTFVFVRLKSGLAAGNYSQNISLNSNSVNYENLIASGSVIGPAITYTWNTTTGDFSTPTNWSPIRNLQADNDILVFNSNATVNLDFTADKNVGKIILENNAQVEFNATGGSKNIYFGYDNVLSPNLIINTGTTLSLNSSTPINLILPTGFTANIEGNLEFKAGAHTLTATDINSIIFEGTAIFETGLGFSGNPFGNTSLNSVVFKNNSNFIHKAGANPFGASQPNSVVVFEENSTFIANTSIGLAFAGRTYGNFILDIPTGSVTATGTSAVSINNLSIFSGTLNLNLTTNSGHSIKGNIFINTGANLVFNPTNSGTFNLNGNTVQIISGDGNFTAGSFSSFAIQNEVVSQKNITLNNVEIGSIGSLLIDPSKQLTVNGNLVNNGIFSLKSDINGTATLLANNVSGTGVYNVQQYLTGQNSGTAPDGRMWYITAPLANATSLVFDAASPLNKLWSYNETTFAYTEITNNSTVLTAGNGYVARMGANTNIEFSSNNINNGNISLNLSRTGISDEKRGFNLIGNPYPSFLNPATAINDVNSNLLPTIWYRTSTGTSMTFNTYNYFSNTGTIGLTEHIPPMQGFWVKVAADGQNGTLNLNNSMRSHQNSISLRNNVQNNTIRLFIDNNINTDEAIVLFNPAADYGYSNWDSPKMHNNNSAISEVYTKEAGNNLVINSMPEITNGMIVPLYINVGTAGQHSITVDLNEFDNTTEILLHDLQASVIHDLRNGSYSFTSTVVSDNNRFNLLFNNIITNTENLLSETTTIYGNDNIIYINTQFDGTIEVYDLLGKLVVSKKVNSGLSNLSLNTKGVYVVRFISTQEIKSTKVTLW